MPFKVSCLLGLVVMAVALPSVEARVVVDPALLTWIRNQVSVRGWTVREWESHYSQFDDASWAEYYSTRTIGGQQWQPEEWLEHWGRAENRFEHPLEAVLIELGETVLLQVLRGAYILFRRSVHGGTGHRYSPY